jgi:hypothetical protein
MKITLNRSLSAIVLQIACVLAGTARADVVVLTPVSDGAGTDQPKDGVFNSFFLSNSVYLVGGQPDADYRSILEFALSSIPAGSTITSAKLQLHAVAGAGSGAPSISMFERLFAGNGVAEIADLTASGTQFGPQTVGLSDNPLIEFAPAFNTLFASHAQFAAITLLSNSNSFIMEFGSKQYGDVPSRPTLTVTYTPVPEPAGLGLLAMGGVGLCFVRRCRARRRFNRYRPCGK